MALKLMKTMAPFRSIGNECIVSMPPTIALRQSAGVRRQRGNRVNKFPPIRLIFGKRLKILCVCVLLPISILGGGCLLIAIRSAQAVANLMHPPRKPVTLPELTGEFAALTAVSFTTSDHLTLRGWYLPSRNHAAVLLTHGFGENRMQMLFEARLLARHGYGVLLFDWRGQGQSDGDRVTWGDLERRDLTAAIDFVTQKPNVDRHRIGAIGFSMGASVVAEVAGVDPRLAAIAIEGIDPSLEEELRSDEFHKWGPISAMSAVWTMRRAGVDISAVRPVDHLRTISPRPILLIDGDKNDVPLPMMKQMLQASGQPIEYWLVKGAGHGEYARVAPKEYADRLLRLFDQALLRSAPL